MSTDPDEAAVAAALAGDNRAFAAVVERHGRALYVFALHILGRASDAEDLVQDTFLAAWRALDRFDPARGRLSTWLFTIARRRAIDRLRQRRDPTPGDPRRASEPVDVRTPPDRMAHAEDLAALDAALAALPAEQRSTLVLADLVGLSHAEVAAIEDIEPGTVKSRVARARATLRARLTPIVHPGRGSP